MATDNFYARLERIERAQTAVAPTRSIPIRELRSSGGPGMTPAGVIRRQRHPIMEHLRALSVGFLLGLVVAVALIGLTWDGSPWGAGTQWHSYVFWPAMGGLAMAGILMVISLFVATKRPGFALFSLGYLTGLVLAAVI